MGVAATKVTLPGRVSVTTTDLASEGPWLSTESVYVAGRPASNGLGLADLVIATSALVSTFVVALACSLPGLGSGVSDDTTALLVMVPGGVEGSTLATMVTVEVAPAARAPGGT